MNSKLLEDGYIIVKNFLPKDLCKFFQIYFHIKKADLNSYKIDEQCNKSISFYGDKLADTLLLTSTQKLSELTEINLIPQYSYTRIYSKGEVLKIHKDRPSCEFSATICLGRPEEEPNNSIFFSDKEDINTGKELILDTGDLCFYRGTEMYHWRNSFESSWYLQTFIHYVDGDGQFKDRIFDGRPYLGLSR